MLFGGLTLASFLLAQAASPSSVWPPPPVTVPSIGSHPSAPTQPGSTPSIGSSGAPPSPASVPSIGSRPGAPVSPPTVPSIGTPGAPPSPEAVPSYGTATERYQPPSVGSQ